MPLDISQLSETELIALNQRIVARLKMLQDARTHHQMLSFDVGDRVRFHPPGHDPKVGLITKCNRKTVTVVTDDRHQWNVAPVFLSRVIETEPEQPTTGGKVIRLPGKS